MGDVRRYSDASVEWRDERIPWIIINFFISYDLDLNDSRHCLLYVGVKDVHWCHNRSWQCNGCRARLLIATLESESDERSGGRTRSF